LSCSRKTARAPRPSRSAIGSRHRRLEVGRSAGQQNWARRCRYPFPAKGAERIGRKKAPAVAKAMAGMQELTKRNPLMLGDSLSS
jgi:hypothetical protein